MFETKKDILTVQELCGALNICKTTAYKYLRKGEIRHIKIGKTYRIPKQYLMDYVNNYTLQGESI